MPLEVLRVIITLVTILLPEERSSFYSVFNSEISPSQTYFVYFIFKPIERLKFYIKTSVFLTSDENTSEPTIGQNGTLGPNSCAIARAIAVFPVPGGPANNKARPAIFLALIKSTATPAAYITLIYYFSCNSLPDQSLRNLIRIPIIFQPKPFHMRMRRYSLCLSRRFNFLNLNNITMGLLSAVWPCYFSNLFKYCIDTIFISI